MPYVDNKGIQIHYETEGEGPPLVLLHGFCGAIEGWYDAGYVSALKPEYRLVLIDLRGHGASSGPHDPQAYRLELLASDVAAVLDDLGIARAHCWGYSMGGRVAWGLARFQPHRLLSLIVGAAPPTERAPLPPDPSTEPMMVLLTSGQDNFVRTLATLGAPWMPADWEERWRRADLEALAAFWSLREHTGVLDALPALQVPCLLYAGDQDPMCAELVEFQPTIPNATFVGLPSLDHMQAGFERDPVLPHIRRFLSSL